MTNRWLRLAAVVTLAASTAACTIRYSQALVGRIPASKGQEVRASDPGLSILQITVNEPTPAHEQVASLLGACSALTKVEVDYREISFFIVGIPEVTITAVCEK